MLRVKQVDEDRSKFALKRVVQIVDVSGEILYNQAKAKQSFTTMMQASVSHELRNPLACLIYKTTELKKLLMRN